MKRTKVKRPMHPEAAAEFDRLQKLYAEKHPENVNPMCRTRGAGPKGKTCGDCSQLFRKTDYTKPYFKCALRGNTNGKGTDHALSWPACAAFVQRTGGPP